MGYYGRCDGLLWSVYDGLLWIMMMLWGVQDGLGTFSERKTGLCGKVPKLGGGLTQTHFLMSTYQVIFGMPK